MTLAERCNVLPSTSGITFGRSELRTTRASETAWSYRLASWSTYAWTAARLTSTTSFTAACGFARRARLTAGPMNGFAPSFRG